MQTRITDHPEVYEIYASTPVVFAVAFIALMFLALLIYNSVTGLATSSIIKTCPECGSTTINDECKECSR